MRLSSENRACNSSSKYFQLSFRLSWHLYIDPAIYQNADSAKNYTLHVNIHIYSLYIYIPGYIYIEKKKKMP